MENKLEERKQRVFQFIKDKDYVPMKFKELAGILMVPKEEYDELRVILNELENEYEIKKNKKQKYMLTQQDYIKGIYKAHEKGYGFVIPEEKKEKDKDIFIPSQYSSNALNGDQVLVEIVREEQEGKRQEGKIIKVIKHERNQIVGTFTNNKTYGFVIPDDKAFGTDIYISKKNVKKAKTGQKVVVKIIKYPDRDKNAEGEIIEIIGHKDDPEVDLISIVKEFGLLYEFPEQVLQEAKNIPNNILEEERSKRVDKRKDLIFTIDGEDAKDLDDAVRVEKLENGNYILEVHIADVSHYVKEDSLLDKEAISRGTSVYMLGKVIPMLPKELSNGICSLNEGQDRLTLSVTAEIDKKGNVVSSDIYKAVINVTKRMSYTKVQKIIDAKQEDKDSIKEYNEYIDKFKQMEELALILRDKRYKKGYLNLDIPESKIILDDHGKVVQIKKYENTFANEIIEQFMLMANEIVAEKFFWLEAPFIYRVHEVPDIEKINELNKFLFNFGYKVKVTKEGEVHPKEFSKILEEIKGKEEQAVISNLILRTLKVARYEEENKGHFGIASGYYCHFTSPIRRYPDLFIHRMISYYLSHNYTICKEYILLHNELAKQYAKISSDAEVVATKAERDSIDMKKTEYMMEKIGEEYEGIISNITSFGVFVELENTIEGLIRFDHLGQEYFIYDEDRKTLLGEKTKVVYQIGNKIKIRVINANKELRQIDFEKVEE